MSAVKYTIHFTALDGSEATITGDSEAISAIEGALEKAGIEYNEQVECWDEGFYGKSKPVLAHS